MAIDQETQEAIARATAAAVANIVQPSAHGAFSQPGGGFAPPQPLTPASVSIPLKMQLPDGREMRIYLNFDVAGKPAEEVQAITAQLTNMYPVDAWMPKQQQGGWGGGGGGYGGNQGGGNWNRGGGGGGRRSW